MKMDLFNISLILFLITVACLLVYAVTFIILGGFNVLSGFSYVGRTEAEILSFDPELHSNINNSTRILGFSYLTVGVFALFILVIPFRNKEKWAWELTVIVVLIFTLPLLILNALRIGFNFYVVLIIFIVQIVALGITFKNFFKKE